MRKNKKPSAYTQKRDASNITDFIAEKSARSYRVERSDEGPASVLKLYAPSEDAPGREKPIDLSFLLDFPMLWEPLSEALATSARIAATPFVTLSGRCTQLKNGFISYLRVAAPHAMLGDITTQRFEDFVVWLGRMENGVPKYKKMSKQHFQMTISAVMNYLQKSDKWKDQLSSELTLRTNYWSGEPDDRDSVKIIPDETYRDIYIACKKEITATMARVRQQRLLMRAQLNNPIATRGDIYPDDAYLSSGKFNTIVWKENPYKDLGLCLAALRRRVPRVILSITELEKMQDKLLLRVVEGTKPFGGIPGIYACFYPHGRDLVPFVLMLAIHFDYNPETLLKSLIRDYVVRRNEVGTVELVASPANINREKKAKLEDPRELLAIEREILARAKKGRSNNAEQPQIRPATDDPDNPASIINFLEEWTSFIRPLAPPAHGERLFLFVTEQGNRGIRSFSGMTTAGSDGVWRNSLKRFYVDHGLPHTALNRFRTTGLDFTDVLFGGDIRAKQAAGNHASPETTYRLYSTNAQRQRGDEFLGQVSQLRGRWRETRGKVDPRNKPSDSDVGAATPGWTCADPFSGPYSPNKICTSYGSCPACPHGTIALNDPYALAQAWNLLYAIDEAASEIAPDAWLTRWWPVKMKLLEVWLPRFPDSIQAKARQIKLAKLPPLE